MVSGGYSNDYINRNIVLTVFIIFYIYLNYNSNQLKRKKNWKGVKCNPLEMVIGSIFDPNSSNSQFEQCMQYSATDEQEEMIEEYSEKLNNELKRSIDKLNSGESANNKATDLLLNKTSDDIQNLRNESLDNETTINDLKIKIQKLTDKVNASFDAFRDPSNNLLTKLEIK